MNNSVSFFLNGEEVTINNPKPDLLLLDYLRSNEVGLTGAKKDVAKGGVVLVLSFYLPGMKKSRQPNTSQLIPV
ncbi:hypothetical protein V8V91_01695 [Algoriphagus halophilus]|uniref:hypothetical protein n=1 Tax=Algoriphagus halophilus TaxID=226505 RepID=UPI00358DFFF7